MYVPLEEVLNPLYEVELQSFISDFPTDVTPEAEEAYKEILKDSLTHIKNLILCCGVTIEDLFTQDTTKGVMLGEKSGKKGKGKSKSLPKGESLEEPLIKGGKSQGKKGSTNKPKEPTPPSKPKESAVIVKRNRRILQANQKNQLLLVTDGDS